MGMPGKVYFAGNSLPPSRTYLMSNPYVWIFSTLLAIWKRGHYLIKATETSREFRVPVSPTFPITKLKEVYQISEIL